MPATLTKEDGKLVLDLSTARGLEFKDGLNKIRDVTGRKYNPENKTWYVEATAANADRIIHSIEPTVGDDLMEWVRQERVNASESLTTPLPDDAELMSPLAETLYAYQRAFVDMAARNQKVLLADDMGLGKTLQAIASIEEWRYRSAVDGVMPDGPKIIVTPNSVKGVWARELTQWIDEAVPLQVIDGSNARAKHNQLIRAIRENAYAIVNYEQLRVKKEKLIIKHRGGGSSERTIEVMKEPLYELPFLAAAEPSLDDLDPRTVERARNSKHRHDWLAAIADEAHRAKNRRASQAKGLHRTRADSGMMLALTGTPLMNAPDELWSILHWLWPDEYTSFWRFYENYVDYTEGYFGKVITGVRNPDALRFELCERLVRRTKAQVLDLPEKTRVTVPVALAKPERKLYDELEAQVWIDLAAEAVEQSNDTLAHAIESGDLSKLLKIPNGAARMTRLQQFLEHPSNLDADNERTLESSKLNACEEIILDNKHIQHVVYCKYKHTTAVFAEILRSSKLRVGVYTGDVDPEDRDLLVAAFQRGDLDVLVGTLESMYQGITLTASSTEHFVGRSWVPAINEQAEDRCHRVGQRMPLTIYIYEAQDTVDDGKVKPANRLKETIVKTVLEKDAIKEATHS